MPRIDTLVRHLEARGLKVEYVPGWSTRGSASFNPKGVMDHWTAGPKGSKTRPSLNVVTYGRPGLPGPLCNVYLDRRGVAVIVAAGRANHAGYGYWKGRTGNTYFFGVEAEAANADDWTDEMRDSYPLLNAGLLDAINEDDASYVCGHSEYALPRGRKIDINGYTMDDMREQTQRVLRGQKPSVKPAGSSKPKPKPKPQPKPEAKKQLNSTPPDGSTVFPTDYEDLILDKDFGEITVGAFQILMEAIKIGVRYNQRWDGDWGKLSVKDAMEWLQSNGYYKKTQHARSGVPEGTKLKVDGGDGYWFWYELQRFLKARGFYNKTTKGVPLKLDGAPEGWTIYGLQRYLNTQNGS
ncbi:peptidoglycan recognition protein family protein [Glutamicibacter sp. Je.9.36]|uniref:peptidoglycan recognition protein family protein n=1 Tax=Glutamicibacter sp. Je.9.36 TaxID=3142837 RepID=UPI003DA82FF6